MKKMNRWKALLSAGLAAVLLAGCGSSSTTTSTDTGSSADSGTTAEATATDESTAESGGENGSLVMATNATFPPYEYVEGSDYEGIDVEIAGKLAEKLGRTLDIQDVEFDTIIGGVQSGKYDIGMAGMTVTDERKESVNFTDSYATGIQSIIVAEDSAIAAEKRSG